MWVIAIGSLLVWKLSLDRPHNHNPYSDGFSIAPKLAVHLSNFCHQCRPVMKAERTLPRDTLMHQAFQPGWTEAVFRFFWLFLQYSISPVQSASRNMTPTHACLYIFRGCLLFLFSASLGLPGCLSPIPLAPGSALLIRR